MKVRSLSFNIVMNGIKQVCAILFPLITFSYSARVLGTENIGIYSYGFSIVSYFLLVSKLGIPNYAIREGAIIRDEREKLKQFVDEVYSINVLMTIVAMIAIVVMLVFSNGLVAYRAIIAIQSFNIILTLIGADWINTICEDYLYLTIRYLIIQVICLLALFIFVRSETALVSYTIISTLAVAGGNLLNIGHLRKNGLYPRFRFKMNFKKHMGPILVLFANSIASVIYLNSDITLLGNFLGDAPVGVYSAATKIYSTAKTLIDALIIVAIPRFSHYIGNNKKKEYEKSFGKLFEIVLMLSVPMMIGIYLEADKLLVLLAGSAYLDGVSVIKILCPAILFATFACFFSYTVLLPYHMEKIFTISTAIGAAVNIVLNLWFVPNLGIDGAAYTTLISEILVCVIGMFFSHRVVKVRVKISKVIKIVIASALFVPVILLSEMIGCHPMILLGIQVVSCVLVYYIALRIMGIDVKSTLKIE